MNIDQTHSKTRAKFQESVKVELEEEEEKEEYEVLCC